MDPSCPKSAHPVLSPSFRLATLWLLWLLLAVPLSAGGQTQPDARFVEFEVPNEIRAGRSFEVRVTMHNSAMTPWLEGDYQLGLRHDPASDNPMIPNFIDATDGPVLFDLPEAMVPANTSVEFILEVAAPLELGTYEFQMRMLEAAAGWFGDHTFRVPVRVACGAVDPYGDNDEVVSVERPEDVQPGGAFEVRVTLRNTGQNCWTAEDLPYVLDMDHRAEMNPWQRPAEPIGLPAGTEFVRPGEEVTFRVPLSATDTADPPMPLEVGSYPVTFRMMRMAGNDPATGAPVAARSFGFITPSTPTIAVTSTSTRKAVVTAVDAPPRIVPDEPSYRVRVKVRNTGSQVWDAASGVILGMIDENPDWSPKRYLLPAEVSEVKPGEEVTFDFELLDYGVSETTPTDAFRFRMVKDCVPPLQAPAECGWFGVPSAFHTAAHWDMSQQVTVDDGAFWVGAPTEGNEFVAAGFTQIPYYEPIDEGFPEGVRGAGHRAWYSYDEEVVAGEMREMARLGATVVRVFAPGELLELEADDPDDPNDDPTINELYRDRMLHTLAEARANGLRAIIGLPGPLAYFTLLEAACIAGELECGPLFAGQSRMLHDPEIRRFVLARYATLIDTLDLADRSEILSLNLWIEMATGDAFARDSIARSAWNDYLDDKYLQNQRDPCTVWGYSGQTDSELAAACADSTMPFPAPDDVEMCCDPAGGAGCDLGTHTGDWTSFVLDYRSFVDLATLAAHQEALNGAAGVPGLRQQMGNTLLTAGAGGVHTSETRIRAACKILGHVPDPRIAQQTMDYVAVDSYPWTDLTEPVAGSPNTDRFDRLKLMLDYARGASPTLLEESGHNTCNTQVDETTMPRTLDAAGDCDARDQVQSEVYQRIADSIAEIDLNGALYFTYRDRRDRAFWGTTRLDGSRKPGHGQLDENLEEISGARDATSTPTCCVWVDPCADVSLSVAILESLAQYQVLGPGPVEVRTPREVGSDCQAFGGGLQ